MKRCVSVRIVVIHGKINNNITCASHKLEFPKKFNVQPLYKLLQELAYENHERLNG